MKRTRDDGVFQNTYDFEMVEASGWVDGKVELERCTVGNAKWFEDTLAYALKEWEKLRPERADFETCELLPDCMGLEWYVPYLGLVQFFVVKDSPEHKRLNALNELLKRLDFYSKKPHPAHAYEIGKAEILLRALMDSEQVRRGQKILMR